MWKEFAVQFASDAHRIGSTIENWLIGLKIKISISGFLQQMFQNNVKRDDTIILVVKYLLFQS